MWLKDYYELFIQVQQFNDTVNILFLIIIIINNVISDLEAKC